MSDGAVLEYGPAILTPPQGTVFSILIDPLPHASVPAPATPSPYFIDTLRLSQQATMNLRFLVVDRIFANTAVTITANSQFDTLICTQIATLDAPSAVIRSSGNESLAVTASFVNGVAVGTELAFSCTVFLSETALPANALVAATVSYPYVAVSSTNKIQNSVRTAQYSLPSNLEAAYVFDVTVGSFLTAKPTVLQLAVRVLDTYITTATSPIDLSFNTAFVIASNAECSSPALAANATIMNNNVALNLNSQVQLGDIVIITCPITTPAAIGALTGPAAKLENGNAITSDVAFTDLEHGFVTGFVTTSDIKSFIASQTTQLLLSFWLYEPLLADAQSSTAKFTLPILNDGFASIMSCKVTDSTGSTARFLNIESTDRQITFDIYPEERSGLQIFIDCVVVNKDQASAGSASRELGIGGIGIWEIPFPDLINEPQTKYTAQHVLHSFIESANTTLEVGFDMLEEFAIGKTISYEVVNVFTIVASGTVPSCTVNYPESFVLSLSGTHTIVLRAVEILPAGSRIELTCNVVNPQAALSPTGFVVTIRTTPVSESRLFNSEVLAHPIVSAYTGTLTADSLLLSEATVIEAHFDALEGFSSAGYGDTILFSYYYGFIAASSNCSLSYTDAELEEVAVAELSLDGAADISARITIDVPAGTTLAFRCKLMAPSVSFDVAILTAIFTLNTALRTLVFPDTAAPFSNQYTFSSQLSSYYPSVAATLTLRSVIMELIDGATFEIELTEVFASVSTCTALPTPSSKSGSSRAHSFNYNSISAGTQLVITCSVTNPASSLDISPGLIIFDSPALGSNQEQYFATLPHFITNDFAVAVRLESFYANRVNTKYTLSFMLLMEWNVGTVVTFNPHYGFHSTFDTLTCTMDGTSTLSISTLKELRFTVLQAFVAGFRVTMNCIVTTPAVGIDINVPPAEVSGAMLLWTQSGSIVSFPFPAFSRSSTVSSINGEVTLDSYYVDEPAVMTFSMWLPEDLLKTDFLSFKFDSRVAITAGATCGVGGTTALSATTYVSGNDASVVVVIDDDNDVAILAGEPFTISCNILMPSTSNVKIGNTTALSQTIYGQSRVIVFNQFLYPILSKLEASSRQYSYINDDVSYFVITFRTNKLLTKGTTIQWNPNPNQFANDMTCQLKRHWDDDELNIGTSSAGFYVDIAVEETVNAAITLYIICDVTIKSDPMMSSLMLSDLQVGNEPATPLSTLLMYPVSSNPVTFTTQFFATKSTTVIQFTYKLTEYLQLGDTVTVTLHSGFKIDAELPSSMSVSGTDMTLVDKGSNTLKLVTTRELAPNENADFFISLIAPESHDVFNDGLKIVRFDFGTVDSYGYKPRWGETSSFTGGNVFRDENLKVSFASYLSTASSVVTTFSFTVTDPFTATTATRYELILFGRESASNFPTISCSGFAATNSSVLGSLSQASMSTMINVYFQTGYVYVPGTTYSFTANCVLYPIVATAKQYLFERGTF